MIEAGMMTYRLKLPIPSVIDQTRIAALEVPARLPRRRLANV
jgi:hypothetical protein